MVSKFPNKLFSKNLLNLDGSFSSPRTSCFTFHQDDDREVECARCVVLLEHSPGVHVVLKQEVNLWPFHTIQWASRVAVKTEQESFSMSQLFLMKYYSQVHTHTHTLNWEQTLGLVTLWPFVLNISVVYCLVCVFRLHAPADLRPVFNSVMFQSEVWALCLQLISDLCSVKCFLQKDKSVVYEQPTVPYRTVPPACLCEMSPEFFVFLEKYKIMWLWLIDLRCCRN